METFAVALNYAIPIFVGLILIEAVYARVAAGVKVRSMDTISSLSSGITNIIKDVLGLTVFIFTYDLVYRHTNFLHLEATWPAILITFIYLDFAGYWKHRLEHTVNYFWNHHIVHHSSEEYNLPCALRQSISEIISIGIFFIFPLALIGVPTEVLAIVSPIHLFAQFWYHTKFIGRLGFLEYFMVTPSHHRVHHAINPQYIDKNYSQIFIIWDKLFGTFQPELKEVPPVYGVKRAVSTWNPFLINFQHLWLIITDAWHTRSWLDKLRIWFMPTGWRPEDVREKYPVEVIGNVYSQVKYETNPSRILTVYSWIQLILSLGIMLYLFNNLMKIGTPDIFVLGTYILVTVFGYTALMDKKSYAIAVELGRCFFGLFIISMTGDFYYMNDMFTLGSVVMTAYFMITILMSIYFVMMEFPAERKLAPARMAGA